MLTFVKNPVGFLILARYNPNISDWEYLNFSIPHEYEDSRFRTACKYLYKGFSFYRKEHLQSLGKVPPVKIPQKILDSIANDPPAYPG
jgi:hypothetical protein